MHAGSIASGPGLQDRRPAAAASAGQAGWRVTVPASRVLQGPVHELRSRQGPSQSGMGRGAVRDHSCRPGQDMICMAVSCGVQPEIAPQLPRSTAHGSARGDCASSPSAIVCSRGRPQPTAAVVWRVVRTNRSVGEHGTCR